MPTYPTETPVLLDLHGRFIIHHDKKRNRVGFERVGASGAGLYDGDDAEQVPRTEIVSISPKGDLCKPS